MAEIIFHLALADDWAAACRVGEYRISTRGRSLDAVGFIHCSRAGQVAGVARRFFSGAGPLVRVYIDRDRVAPAVIDDEVPGGERFPHIYGPLGLDAVVAISPTDPVAAADDGWAASARCMIVGVDGPDDVPDPARTAADVDGVCQVLAARAAERGWRLVADRTVGSQRLVADVASRHGAAVDEVSSEVDAAHIDVHVLVQLAPRSVRDVGDGRLAGEHHVVAAGALAARRETIVVPLRR